MPPMTTKENIKLQWLKILQARNSDNSGVNSGLGLLLSIGGYGLLLEVNEISPLRHQGLHPLVVTPQLALQPLNLLLQLGDLHCLVPLKYL